MRYSTGFKLILPAAFFGYAAWANTSLLMNGEWNGMERAGFMKGEMAQQIDGLYREALPHREPAVGLIGAARYVLLNEGRDGVVAGNDGWLFSKEEFRPLDTAPVALADTVAWMQDAQRKLAAQGAELVILPLPAKLDIAREMAGDEAEADRIAREYETFVAALEEAGLSTFDTREVMEGTDAAFFRTDTHWTGEEAALVADAFAASGLVTPGDTEFEVSYREPVEFVGDLVSFVTSDTLAPAVGLGAEQVTPYTATAVDSGGGLDLGLDTVENGATDLFGADAPEGVALVGTSYSANPNWSFAEALKVSLGQDVFNYALEGQGPVVPMQAFLDGIESETPPPVVIWEFPVRYLTDPALMGEDATETEAADV